jgi:hypothetical protein
MTRWHVGWPDLCRAGSTTVVGSNETLGGLSSAVTLV